MLVDRIVHLSCTPKKGRRLTLFYERKDKRKKNVVEANDDM